MPVIVPRTLFFFSSRRRHTRSTRDWSSDVCSSDLAAVVLSRFYHKIKHLQPGTALEVVIATNIKEFLPRLLRLAYTLLKERKEGDRVALAPGDVWVQAVIRASPAAAPPRAGPSPSDVALLIATGGTTGVPKAALLRHRGVLMAALQLSRWFQP